MIDRRFADRFSAEWIAAWNSHDLDRVLSHYADDFEMSSPIIAQIAGEPSGKLKGKKAVGAYWSSGLKLIPDLHFELVSTLVGAGSITFITKVIAAWWLRYSFLALTRKWPRHLRTTPANFLAYLVHDFGNDPCRITPRAVCALRTSWTALLAIMEKRRGHYRQVDRSGANLKLH
jgi:hypothetical protein